MKKQPPDVTIRISRGARKLLKIRALALDITLKELVEKLAKTL